MRAGRRRAGACGAIGVCATLPVPSLLDGRDRGEKLWLLRSRRDVPLSGARGGKRTRRRGKGGKSEKAGREMRMRSTGIGNEPILNKV